jgi:hypothetical protein
MLPGTRALGASPWLGTTTRQGYSDAKADFMAGTLARAELAAI